jgi:hypothetical protein
LRIISGSNTPLFHWPAAAEAVFTIVTGAWLFRRGWRNAFEGKSATRSDTGRVGRAGAGIGSLAFTVGGSLAGLLVFASLLTAGVFFAAFVTWIVPMPPAERFARRELAERIQGRRDLDQLLPRSKHYGSKNHHKRRK